MKNIRTFAVLALLAVIAFLPNHARAGWGVDSGRATEQDVFDLQTDWTELRRSMKTIELAAAESSKEARYLQLLKGIVDGEGKYTLTQLALKMDEWLKVNVNHRMADIASNPAASCAESRHMLKLLLEVQRLKQLQEIISEDDGPYVGEAGKLLDLTRVRCHEEALDECNTTGRFEQIINMQTGEQKEMARFGITADDKWAIEALKECAIYELHYRSEGDINDAFKLHTLIDGRVPMKLIQDDGPTSINDLALSKTLVEGETKSDVNPFLETVDCAGDGVVVKCAPGGSVQRPAWGQLLVFKQRYREYDVDRDGNVTQSQKGEPKLEVKFLSGMLLISSFVHTEVGVFPVPIGGSGATSFHIAHRDKRVEDDKVLLNAANTRGTMKTGVYPVLFEFSIEGNDVDEDIKGSDMTRFELIHKPKRKPFPPRPPTPKRVPLRPRG